MTVIVLNVRQRWQNRIMVLHRPSLIILIVFIFGILLVQGCGNRTSGKEVEQHWKALLKKTGCLTGRQNWSEIGPGVSIFKEREWQKFFSYSPKLSIPFLLSRIDSQNSTKVHVCPFDMASEGELAVYASEYILKSNWFDTDRSYRRLYEWSLKRHNHNGHIIKMMLLDPKVKQELRSYFQSKIE